jgi:hypothetical protein
MRLSQAIFPIVISHCFRILLPHHLLSMINTIRGDRGIRERTFAFLAPYVLVEGIARNSNMLAAI